MGYLSATTACALVNSIFGIGKVSSFPPTALATLAEPDDIAGGKTIRCHITVMQETKRRKQMTGNPCVRNRDHRSAREAGITGNDLMLHSCFICTQTQYWRQNSAGVESLGNAYSSTEPFQGVKPPANMVVAQFPKFRTRIYLELRKSGKLHLLFLSS